MREQQAKLKAEATKEARNAEALRNENSFLREQLKRANTKAEELKKDLLEEQVTKQNTINGLEQTVQEALKSADHHQKAFDGQRQKVAQQDAQIESYRVEYESILRMLQKKMAEDKPNRKLEEQEARIADLQTKNEALEKNVDDLAKMAANQPAAEIEELRGSIKTLEQRNEGLNTEFDSMRARLEAAEKKLTETTVSYRHAQAIISNNDATIKNLERQIEENEEDISNLQQEVKNRDSRIKSKEGDLKNRVAEVASLNSINNQLGLELARLRSQNEKLEIQAQDKNVEIEVLREASRDCIELETALAEVQATAAQLKNEIISLEQSNSELKSRLDEYHPFARTSNTGSNLESELSASDFLGAEDETLFALNDGSTSNDSPEAIAAAHITAPISETPDITLSSDVATHQAIIADPEVPDLSQVTQSPEIIQSSEVTQTPLVTQSPEVVTSPEATQSPVVISPPAVTTSPAITTPCLPLPVVILKSHNPLECWLQVYIDLWILFVFWFHHRFAKSFGEPNIGSSTGSVIQDDPAAPLGDSSLSSGHEDIGDHLQAGLVDGGRAEAPLPAATHGDIAPLVTTIAPSSKDHAKLDSEIPDVWITIFAFSLHLLFYAVIMVCVSNYRAVLHERSIWLSANEMTRQYLHMFYKASFKREYGMFHELFGPVRFLDVWRYNVHSWAKISRSLPG